MRTALLPERRSERCRAAKMKRAQLILCITAVAALLFALALNAASAQSQRNDTTKTSPTPTPTPRPKGPTRFPVQGGERLGRATAADNNYTHGIYGSLRWKKELGLPSTDGGKTINRSLNCAAFRIEASVQTGTPGTFGSYQSVGSTIINHTLMRVEENSYVCDFTVTGIPLNENVSVRASVIERAQFRTARWHFGSQPQPPPGSERMILNGNRNVNLTTSEPTATVDFEMVYNHIPTQPG